MILEQEFYKITVVIPGLLLESNVQPSSSENISVFAKMVCGCKVTTGLSTSFWSPNDFMVNATVLYKDSGPQQ